MEAGGVEWRSIEWARGNIGGRATKVADAQATARHNTRPVGSMTLWHLLPLRLGHPVTSLQVRHDTSTRFTERRLASRHITTVRTGAGETGQAEANHFNTCRGPHKRKQDRLDHESAIFQTLLMVGHTFDFCHFGSTATTASKRQATSSGQQSPLGNPWL